jgi:hypothetical protein
MISKYNEFILESLIEGINESIVYYSPNLRGILRRIKSEIAQDLLDLEEKEIKDDITFIDVDNKEGFINFTTDKNAKKNLEIKYPAENWSHIHDILTNPNKSFSDALYTTNNHIWTNSRNPLRIGRLIGKVFPGKYTPQQIEEFTNKFKATREKTGERFELVKGDEIAYWYDSKKYFDNCGTLGNSCMKAKSEGVFEIYTKNPEVCQMLCLFDENNNGETKLKARAIVWKVSRKLEYTGRKESELEFEFFMDRQYTIDDSLVEKMRNYATEKGWSFKTKNNSQSCENITFNGSEFNIKLEIQLKQVEGTYRYKLYPYMDTFKRYNPFNGVLHNDEDRDDHNEQYILEDTAGGFDEISTSSTVYSEYYDCDVDEDESVYSDKLGDYLPRDRAVYIRIGSTQCRGWYPEDWDDIVYDEWDSEYLHVDDAVWSDEYDYYLYNENAVSIVDNIDDTGKCNSRGYFIHQNDFNWISFKLVRRTLATLRSGIRIGTVNDYLDDLTWFKIITTKFSDWHNHTGIKKSLLTDNWNNEWILLKFKIEVYRLTTPISNLEYMTQLDADLLDLEVDISDVRISDEWTYTEELKNAGLIKRLKSAINYKIKHEQLELDFGKDFKRQEEFSVSYNKRLQQLNNFLLK